jgi:cyanate lyase
LLHQGRTWDQVQRTLGVTRAFVAACARRLAAVEVAQSRAAILDSRQDGLATSLADD